VFKEIPTDELNSRIDEEFFPKPISPLVPQNARHWERMKRGWMADLIGKTFAGWPAERGEPWLRRLLHVNSDGLELRADEFISQPGVSLRIWTVLGGKTKPKRTVVRVLNDESWLETLSAFRAAAPARVEELVGPGAHSVVWPEANSEGWAEIRDLVNQGNAVVFVATRGIGPTYYEEDRDRGDTITRSFQLLGQTADGMRVWDLRQALIAIRKDPDVGGNKTVIEAAGSMAGVALYSSLFDEPADELRLENLPVDHHNGPILIGIDSVLNLPQTLAMARDRTRVVLIGDRSAGVWSDQLQRTLRGRSN
jgi:hypothetical protein